MTADLWPENILRVVMENCVSSHDETKQSSWSAVLYVGLYQILALVLANLESNLFRNPAKSGSGQISSQIWQTPVQLQYVQLITDKTNAANLSNDVFAILISLTRAKKYKIQISSKLLTNSDVTKEALNCTASLWQLTALFTPLVSSGVLFCDPKKQVLPNLDPASFEFLNPARPGSGRIWKSQIWYNPIYMQAYSCTTS